jgi:hypothetical protein
MIALDDVIDGPVDLVKMDVQGYEGHVLSGMEDLVRRSKQLAMLVEYAPCLLLEAETDPGELIDRLKDLGFAIFEIDEPNATVRGVERAALMERAAPGGDLAMGYTNLLCTKDQR